MNLIPAYGRDYKSIKAITADFEANLDFVISDHFHPYSGKPVNRSQIVGEGITAVYVRYANQRKVAKIKV